MNSVIETVIARILSPYLEGISRENLELGIFRGDLTMTDLKVKNTLLRDIGVQGFEILHTHVGHVSVKIPWKNPLSGQVEVHVSGVTVRVKQGAVDGPPTNGETKRAAIDVIKRRMELIDSKKLQLSDNSFLAKMARKIINSIIVTVHDVDLVVVVEDDTLSEISSIDKEGFADATEEPDRSKFIQLHLGGIDLVGVPEQTMFVRKRLEISDFSIAISGGLVLPPCSLAVDLSYDSAAVSLAVSGMDNCNIALSRSQLETVNSFVDALQTQGGGHTRSSTPEGFDLTESAQNEYRKLYIEGLTDTPRFAELTLAATANTLARIEASVDKPASNQLADDLVDQIANSESVAVPQKFTCKIEMGKKWTVCVDFFSAELEGFSVDMSATQTDGRLVSGNITFTSFGFVVHGNDKTEPIMAFRESQSPGIHSMASMSSFSSMVSAIEERESPLMVRVDYALTDGEPKLSVSGKTCPLWVRYEVGLVGKVRELVELFEDNEMDYPKIGGYADYVKAKTTSVPKLDLDLFFAGPYLVFPSSRPGEQIQIRLGDLSVQLPDGEPTVSAVFSNARILCFASPEETFQVMAPTVMELTGQFSREENSIDISINLDSILDLRLNLSSVRIIERVARTLVHEFATVSSHQVSIEEDLSSIVAQRNETQNQFFDKLIISARIKEIALLVSDGCTDVLKCTIAIPIVSGAIHLDPSISFMVAVEEIRFISKIMNAANGEWEPLVEPFILSMICNNTEEETEVGSKGPPINVIIESRTALNLVASVDTIKTLRGIANATFDHSHELPVIAPNRYRVVNATLHPLYLCAGRISADHAIEILPSDEYVAIDKIVLSRGVREVVISIDREDWETPGSVVRVPIDKLHSCLIDSGNFLVQSMLAKDRSFRTVLISHNAFIFNRCSVPLEVSLGRGCPTPRYVWIGSEKRRVTQVVSKKISKSDSLSASVILNPGTFVSVPYSGLHFNLRPAELRPPSDDLSKWSSSLEVGERPSSIMVSCGGEFFIRVESDMKFSALPLSARTVEVNLLPPFAIDNTTPVTIQVALQQQRVLVVPPHSRAESHDGAKIEKPRIGLGTADKAEWTKELTLVDGADGTRFWLSPDSDTVHPIHLTIARENIFCVTVSSKWWLVNRTGLGLEMFMNDQILPRGDADAKHIWMLPDPDSPCTVTVYLGKSYFELTLPDAGWIHGWVSDYPLVFVARESFGETAIKRVEILPRYTVFNGLDVKLELSNGDILEPHEGTVLKHHNFKFLLHDLIGGPSSNFFWSCSVPVQESSAGVWPVQVGPSRTVRVEIAPVNGVITVTIRPGSSIMLRNEKARKPVFLITDNGTRKIQIPPKTTQFIGWIDPFAEPESHTILQVPHTDGILSSVSVSLASAMEIPAEGISIVPGEESQSIVIIARRRSEYISSTADQGRLEFMEPVSSPDSFFRVQVHCQSIGVSVIHNSQEIVYAELGLIRALLLQDRKSRRVSLVVSEMQVDTGVSASVIANRGEGVKPFLEAVVEQRIDVSYGVAVVPLVTCELDDLIVEVDSLFMTNLDEFIREVLVDFDDANIDLGPVMRGTVIGALVPTILILDRMEIAQLQVRLWVDFALKSMLFLPVSLKLVVGMLSLGGSFRLDGATVKFRPRTLPGYKGPSVQFTQSLIQEYGGEAIRNMANILGSSSLLTIPRAPIQLVTGVGAFGLEKATGAVGDVGELISNLANDPEYRAAQLRIRQTKNIRGFADGFVEGAARLGEGAEGMLDIVKQPFRRAKDEGVKGFFAGLGTGLIGSIVKPVTKVGEAIQDIGEGIARSVGPGKSDKPFIAKKRFPRAFYGPMRSVDDYRGIDAFVFHKLTEIGQIDLVLRLMEDSQQESFRVVIFSGTRLSVAMISVEDERYTDAQVEVKMTVKDVRNASVDLANKTVSIGVSDGKKYTFSLSLPSDYTAAILNNIAATLTTGMRKGHFDWRETKQILATASTITTGDSELFVSGKKVVEVYEVERFLMAYGWVTPYMLLDSGSTGWRWVDSQFRKHPKIKSKMTKSAAAKSKRPPVEMSDLWKATDEWQVVIDPELTDMNGWQYAVSFSSSTWLRTAGITASVRKRLWTKSYS